MSKFVQNTDTPSGYAAPEMTTGRDGFCVAAQWNEAAEHSPYGLRGKRPIGFEAPHFVHVDQEATSIAARICATANDEEPEDGIDLIYMTIDGLLCDGAFEVVDRVLMEGFETLPVVHLLALLSITWPASDKLAHRKSFAQRVRERILRDDNSRADELLSGLE